MARSSNGTQQVPLGSSQRKLRQTAFDFLGDVPRETGPFPFAQVSPDLVRDAIATWVGHGHAITFGSTSDGGAMGVHLLANGDRRARYFVDVAELEDFLATVRDA